MLSRLFRIRPYAHPRIVFAFALAMLTLPSTASASSTADITFSCFGFFNNVFLEDPYQAALSETAALTPGGGTANLEGAGFGNLATASTPPTQGASGWIDALNVTLMPFNRCVVNGGNILVSEVYGQSESAPQSSGTADALLRFHYEGLHEYESVLGNADWKAAASVFFDIKPSLFGSSFEVVASSLSGLSVPSGLTAQDVSIGGMTRYLVSGTVEIEASFSYGPSAVNELNVTHFGGGSFDGFSLGQKEEPVVSGAAGWNGLNTLTYEIVSLDPDIQFSFTKLPEPSSVTLQFAALASIGLLANASRKSRM